MIGISKFFKISKMYDILKIFIHILFSFIDFFCNFLNSFTFHKFIGISKDVHKFQNKTKFKNCLLLRKKIKNFQFFFVFSNLFFGVFKECSLFSKLVRNCLNCCLQWTTIFGTTHCRKPLFLKPPATVSATTMKCVSLASMLVNGPA